MFYGIDLKWAEVWHGGTSVLLMIGQSDSILVNEPQMFIFMLVLVYVCCCFCFVCFVLFVIVVLGCLGCFFCCGLWVFVLVVFWKGVWG